jgi:hypothetical protein
MPRDLFGDVTSPRVSVGGKKWYTVPLSLAAHVALIVPLVLVPLLASDILPTVRAYDVFMTAAPAPPDPPVPSRPRPPETKPQVNPDAAPGASGVAVHSAARSGRHPRGAAVGIHRHVSQRNARRGHHDRHRHVQAELNA